MKNSGVLCTIIFLVMVPMLILTGCRQEPEIASQWDTYTDKLQLFSISYPPDWEADISRIQEMETAAKAILESRESGLPLEEATMVFLGGCPTGNGNSPSLNIWVEPAIGVALDEAYAADIIIILQELWQDFELYEQTKTVVGGVDALLTDYAATVPRTGRYRVLTMNIIHEGVCWTVSSGTIPKEFGNQKDTIYRVVKSFRILQQD